MNIEEQATILTEQRKKEILESIDFEKVKELLDEYRALKNKEFALGKRAGRAGFSIRELNALAKKVGAGDDRALDKAIELNLKNIETKSIQSKRYKALDKFNTGTD